MFAKHYENPTMLSQVTAKNVGDVFLRHTVVLIVFSEKFVPVHETITVFLFVSVSVTTTFVSCFLFLCLTYGLID